MTNVPARMQEISAQVINSSRELGQKNSGISPYIRNYKYNQLPRPLQYILRTSHLVQLSYITSRPKWLEKKGKDIPVTGRGGP
jgi:hypothetical protein